jgi:DNA-binding LacI/PurR family transcriptional regulator
MTKRPARLRMQRSGLPTAKEIAAELGVSQSTVSRAFTKDASISAEMRARVMAAAAKVGYKPNAIARSLITRRTGIVGIVMGDLTNPFYPEVLEALTRRLQRDDLRTLLFNVPEGHEIDEALPLVLQYQVDAVVITSATLSSGMAGTCAARGTPVVLLNRNVPGSGVHAVACDNYEGGRAIARFLAERGHRRLAYAAGKPDTTTNLDREKGFVDQLADLGMELWDRAGDEDFTHDAGYRAALRLLEREQRPDAIFFANDIMAIGGIDAIRRETGLSIPGDVSIVGFDDIRMAEWPSNDLTTLRQPIPEMVEQAGDILAKYREGEPSKPEVHLIHGQLIERGSTIDRRVGKVGKREEGDAT